MQKFTLFLSILVCSVFAQAQNLLTNSDFETWDSGKPTKWEITTTGSTITQSTTTPSGSGSALQIAATATISTTEVISTGIDVTKQYKLTVKYKVAAGDGTDARMWCNWITSPAGATIVYSKMSLADSLAMKGPGGNVSPPSGTVGNGTNGYLTDNRTGNWLTYTYTFTPPADAKQFSFTTRTYNGATVIWDDFYFGLAGTSGLNAIEAGRPIFKFVNNRLTVTNAQTKSVEIFNIAGTKLETVQLVNGSVTLNLSRGVYIVRNGAYTAKILQ